MTWETLAFLLVAGTAFGISGYKFSLLYKVMRAQTGKAPTFKDWGARIGQLFINVLGQKAVLQSRWVGTAHTMIFWGFIVITIGTLEQFAMTLYSGASFEFIGESAYYALIWSQDFFTLLVLVGVLMAAARRYLNPPKYLGQSSDANFVLIFTGSLMVSIFLMNAFHSLGNPWFKEAFFISSGIGNGIASLGFTEEQSHTGFTVFKWIHMLLVLGFAVFIPGSKHLHIIAAGPNTVLKHLPLERGMKSINFEDETVTQYGAAKITDFSWKDALDLYSCTECGRCESLCPAWNTGKPLSPKSLIVDMKKNLHANKAAIIAGKSEEVTPLIDANVTEDVIWACTSCRACEVACPVFIGHTDKIYDARRNLMMMESKFPAEVQPVFKNMETNGTPWAFSASDRANWAQGSDVKTLADIGSATELDAVLWVGCAGSYDDRNKSVLKSFVNVLHKAQIKFAILGTEEQCTGDAARRIGNEYLFQTLAKMNIETLNRYQVKRIITACPHCFNTLKNEYKDFGGDYEVIHHSTYLAKLIAEGRIKPAKEMKETVTFHDSCYLGRWNGIYDAPRTTLGAVKGVNLVEMKQNKETGLCCGAGGGRMWMEETIGDRINVKRTEQAIETGASVVATSCPFCMTMISDGVKTKDKVDAMRVMDIAEIVDQTT